MTWQEFNLRCRKTREPFLVSRIFFRPVSLPVTYVLYNLGVSANTVSVFVILLGLAGVVSLVAGSSLLGFILIQLSFLFDHVDGNLARVRGGGTLAGDYLDALGHLLTTPGMFFALGAYVSRSVGNSWLALAGGTLCALSVCRAGVAAKDRIMLNSINSLEPHMRVPEVVRATSSKPWLDAEHDGITSRRLERFAAEVLSEHLLFPGWQIIVPFSCVLQSRFGIPVAVYVLGVYSCLTIANTTRTTIHYYRCLQDVDQIRTGAIKHQQ